MDTQTILFIFLGVALAIYVIVMIEAATDRGIKLKKKPFEAAEKEQAAEEKGERSSQEEKPSWPPEEEIS